MTTPIRTSRSRAMMFGALSLLVATGTAWVAWRVVDQYEHRLDDVRAEQEARGVVVAVNELRPGAVIRAEDIRLEQRVVSGPASLYTDPNALVGLVVGERMLAGEVIRSERLISGGAQLRVNELLDKGTRAVTVRASRASAVGGLLEPGFFVDVIVTIRPDVQTLAAEWVTETILQGVRVLAVGDEVSIEPTNDKDDRARYEHYAARETWVTLEVEPAEAEQLALSAARGQLHLSLRPEDDFDVIDVGTPLVTNALVGLPPPVEKAQARRLARKQAAVAPRTALAPTPEAPTPPAHITETIRGGKITEVHYDAQGNVIPDTSKK